MVIVKCKDCGKEYQLNSSDNPNEFQCSCGGDLEYKIDITVKRSDKKRMKSISDFRKDSDKSKSKTKDNSDKKDYKDLKKLRSFIEKINKCINPLSLIVGLAVSVIILIIASFIFGALLAITDVGSILFYGTITLVTMTLLGSLVTSFLGSHNIDEGVINGTLLSLILLIGMGLIIGFVLFVVIGLISSLLTSFSSIGSSAANTTSGSASSPISWLNIVYGIVGIILTIIAGAGGGTLGVFIKKKLKLPL